MPRVWFVVACALLIGCNKGPEDKDGDGFTGADDCNDNSAAVHSKSTIYKDEDQDGFGDPDTVMTNCGLLSGYTTKEGDCDDSDPDFNPEAEETDCSDPNDYNCDGKVDFVDEDKDGSAECVDCDDGDDKVYPDAEEICNGIDDDCDGKVDKNAVDAVMYFADKDKDTYGDPNDSVEACSKPSDYVLDGTDCFDADPDIHPGSSEIEVPGDGKDMDCDGNDYCTDFTCDGLPDILAVNNRDDGGPTGVSSWLYENTGTGGYTTTDRDDVTLDGPRTALSADIDGDGYLDVLFTKYENNGSTPHTIFWGSATGFSASATTVLADAGTRDARILDIDGDGNLDVILASYWQPTGGRDSQIAVHYGDGARGFVSVYMPGQSTFSVDAGDIDGDGHTDLVLGSFTTNEVLVYWGTSARFSPAAVPTTLTSGSVVDIDLVDLDNDGNLDIVAACYSATSYLYTYDASAGDFVDVDRYELAVGRTASAAAADLNGDGKMEVVFARDTMPDSLIYTWQLSDGWSDAHKLVVSASNARHVVIEDLDGDTNPDLVFATQPATAGAGADAYVYWGSANGAYSASRREALPTPGAYNVRIADLEQDGYPDLLFAVLHDNSDFTTNSLIFYQDANGFSSTNKLDLPTEGAYALIVGETLYSPDD